MNCENNATRRGLPWFRLYAEIVDDPKLRLLTFEDRWHFVAILALKCSGVLDSTTDLGLLHRMVAVKLGVQACELEPIAKRLAEVSLVVADTLQPLAWDRRQAPSDSSRGRTKEWRERHHTIDCRHGDRQVTAQREKEKESKKESESESEKEQSGKQVRSRGSRLSLDWNLENDWRQWARTQRPDLNIEHEAEKFADYWHAKPGKDGCKVDWKATWRNWIRSARQGFECAAPAKRQSATDRVLANIQRAQEHDQHRALIEGEGGQVVAMGVANA